MTRAPLASEQEEGQDESRVNARMQYHRTKNASCFYQCFCTVDKALTTIYWEDGAGPPSASVEVGDGHMTTR